MTTPIRIGLVIEGFFDVPFWAGVEGGEFAARGLDVEVVVLGGVDPLTEALRRGDVQIAVGSPEHVIQDVEAGGSLAMVAGNLNRLTHSLIVRPDIERLADLRGRTIGVSALSAGTSSLWRAILAGVGLRYPEDYTLVEAGPVPPRHDKLLSGEIDAAMQTDPHNYLGEDAGLGNLGPVLDLIPYFQFTSVNVDRRWARENVGALTDLLDVVLDTSARMYDDPGAAVDIASHHMPIDRTYLHRAWHDHIKTEALPRDLRLLRNSIDTAAQMMRLARAEEFAMASDTAADDYVDTSYLLAAQRRRGLPEQGLV